MIRDASGWVDSTSTRGSSGTGKLVVAVTLLAALAAFFYFDLDRYLSLDALEANPTVYKKLTRRSQ